MKDMQRERDRQENRMGGIRKALDEPKARQARLNF